MCTNLGDGWPRGCLSENLDHLFRSGGDRCGLPLPSPPNRSNAPRPVAKSGSVAGRGAGETSPEFGDRRAWRECVEKYHIDFSDDGSYRIFARRFFIHNQWGAGIAQYVPEETSGVSSGQPVIAYLRRNIGTDPSASCSFPPTTHTTQIARNQNLLIVTR